MHSPSINCNVLLKTVSISHRNGRRRSSITNERVERKPAMCSCWFGDEANGAQRNHKQRVKEFSTRRRRANMKCSETVFLFAERRLNFKAKNYSEILNWSHIVSFSCDVANREVYWVLLQVLRRKELEFCLRGDHVRDRGGIGDGVTMIMNVTLKWFSFLRMRIENNFLNFSKSFLSHVTSPPNDPRSINRKGIKC